MSRKRTNTVRQSDSATRTERLGFRLDKQTKRLIERAAHLQGRKVTQFCVTALAQAARRTIEQHESLVLSERDRSVFFDTLMAPPPANDRLNKAFKAARRRVGT